MHVALKKEKRINTWLWFGKKFLPAAIRADFELADKQPRRFPRSHRPGKNDRPISTKKELCIIYIKKITQKNLHLLRRKRKEIGKCPVKTACWFHVPSLSKRCLVTNRIFPPSKTKNLHYSCKKIFNFKMLLTRLQNGLLFIPGIFVSHNSWSNRNASRKFSLVSEHTLPAFTAVSITALNT